MLKLQKKLYALQTKHAGVVSPINIFVNQT